MSASPLFVRVEPLGTCPRCSGEVGVSFDEAGNVSAVVHAQPPCVTFVRMDADAFLRLVISLRAAQRAGGVRPRLAEA